MKWQTKRCVVFFTENHVAWKVHLQVSTSMAKFYDNTLEHVLIQQEDSAEDNKYAGIQVPPLLRS